eukprot:45322_1
MSIAILNDLLQYFQDEVEVNNRAVSHVSHVSHDLLIFGYTRMYLQNKYLIAFEVGIIDLIKQYEMDSLYIWRSEEGNGGIKHMNIKDVNACFMNGGENIMMMTKHGSVFCVGINSANCFGMDLSDLSIEEINRLDYEDDIYGADNPMEHNYFGIKYNRKIKFISEGVYGHHNFAVLQNNDIYGFGGDNGCGELGIPPRNENENEDTDYHPFLVPRKININFKSKETIISVKCGGYFSMILTCSPSNNVWTCGDNECGQLGLGHTQNGDEFTLIKSLIDVKCIDINCGINSSYIIDNNKNVWSFGAHDNGRLGIGAHITDDQLSPVKIGYFIENNIKIKQLKCGDRHVCCISDTNDAFTFGHNEYGQCGNGTTNDVFLPFKIIIKNAKIITKIECGSANTKLLDKESNLYLFGLNWRSFLHPDDSDNEAILEPHFISFQSLKFKLNDNNITKIMDVKSAETSFLITN